MRRAAGKVEERMAEEGGRGAQAHGKPAALGRRSGACNAAEAISGDASKNEKRGLGAAFFISAVHRCRSVHPAVARAIVAVVPFEDLGDVRMPDRGAGAVCHRILILFTETVCG